MRGALEEVIEPALSIAMAIILAMVIGGIAYIFLDILGKELSARHPALLSLQYAGLTAAVASAPQKAVYCHRIHPAADMLTVWTDSAVLTQITEVSAVSAAFGSPRIYIGQMPQPYQISASFNIRRNTPIIIAMQKNETGIHVFEIDSMEECEALV